MTERLLQRGKSSGRSDDNETTIKARLDTYEKETFPVIQRFKEEGICIDVRADQTP